MEKTRREIECLVRLNDLQDSYSMILEFLISEALISSAEVKAMRASSEIAKKLQLHLAQASAEGKLQLLSYEWTILPVERVRILIVTNRASKEFSFNF